MYEAIPILKIGIYESPIYFFIVSIKIRIDIVTGWNCMNVAGLK